MLTPTQSGYDKRSIVGPALADSSTAGERIRVTGCIRDGAGNPTGVLKDEAMNYVYKVIPAFSFEQKMEYLQAATDYAASLGITTASS